MKKILIIMCIVFAIVCCFYACFAPEKYVCDIDKVDSIQIVRLDDVVEYEYEYTVLSEISDCDTFVSRLNKMDRSVNWGEPSVLYLQYIVIKVNYINGDVDWIHHNAQSFDRSGVSQTGYFFFDKEQFESLISDYMNNQSCFRYMAI